MIQIFRSHAHFQGTAVDGVRSEREIEFEAEVANRRRGWLGEEFDDAGDLRRDWPGCGAGAMVSESAKASSRRRQNPPASG